MKHKIIFGIISITLLFILGCSLEKSETAAAVIELQLVEEGFNSPVELLESPDDSDRLFVVDRIGFIKIIGNDGVFLDIRDKMVELRSSFDERGLLGLAFHPDFRNNGRFFAYYSAPLREQGPEGWDHTSRISEFKVSDDPNKAAIDSEKIIMEIDEPQFNHDGGQLLFGPDDYLYIAVGDGGNADDVGLGHTGDIGNAQDTSNLLGSILRIDVDNGEPYAIPEDNPFVGKEGRDEIYAYGLRNPYRMSFDKTTDRLFAGDVGQNVWEEVNIIEKGKNYGWNIKEGTHCFNTENPNESPEECTYNGELVDPILEYNHDFGISVIGGFVYIGNSMPELQGKYVFGDWSTNFVTGNGLLFIAEEINNKWNITETIELDSFLLGFGQDAENEIYVLTTDSTGPTGNTGMVYKIISNEVK